MGIYIPLYTYPTSPSWDEAVQIRISYPTVPILGCINPSNGPGKHFDKKFEAGIQRLKDVGAVLGGYTATHYGDKSMDQIKREITQYSKWYKNLDGICFDQMQSRVGKEEYYKSLTDFSKSLGFDFTIGNPGTSVSPSYIGTVDYLKIYESPGTPELSKIKDWYDKHGRANFITISYGVPSLNNTFLREAQQYINFLYITDDKLPNPYNTLPSYIVDLAKYLNSTYDNRFNDPLVSVEKK